MPLIPLVLLASLPAVHPVGATPSIAVVGSLSHEFPARPGERYEGTIELRNSGTTPGVVKVFQSDYIFFADGRSVYGEPGLLPRSNARWITYTPTQLTVPPNETMRVQFEIQIPDDPALRGTYWSILMLEPIAEGSVESTAQQDDRPTLTIRQIFRYGVQIIADMAATEALRQIRFARLELEKREGRPSLSVDVENTGERWLVGELSVELYDRDGSYTGRFLGGKKRLFPGTSARYMVDLSGLDLGTYQALLVLDGGGDDVFGTDVTLVIQ